MNILLVSLAHCTTTIFLWLVLLSPTSSAWVSGDPPFKLSHKIESSNIEIVDLRTMNSSFFKDFYSQWNHNFPPSSHLHHYNDDGNATDKESSTMAAIHEAFAFAVKWLPSELVGKLCAFPYDPHGPSALVIRGLPIDEVVPPTPVKDNFSTQTASNATSNTVVVPVAETWLLGISRLLGIPHVSSFGNTANVLVRDIIPISKDELDDLAMHRDHPRQALGKFVLEPEMLVLLAVRADPEGMTKTIVCDSAKLLEALDDKDIQLLQSNKVQVKINGTNFGDPFFAIEPTDDDNNMDCSVTLYDFPGALVTSPEGGAATIEAYHRMAKLSFEKGERIALEPGDMLIINNGRLVHGRTKYVPRMDGTDRWLVKSYVSNGIWGKPGTGATGRTAFPDITDINPPKK